jgi:hypothetical protein
MEDEVPIKKGVLELLEMKRVGEHEEFAAYTRESR